MKMETSEILSQIARQMDYDGNLHYTSPHHKKKVS